MSFVYYVFYLKYYFLVQRNFFFKFVIYCGKFSIIGEYMQVNCEIFIYVGMDLNYVVIEKIV